MRELRGFEIFKIELECKSKKWSLYRHFICLLKALNQTQYSIYTMPPRRRSTSKAIHAEANVAEAGEMGRQKRKTKAKMQSHNSGPPDTTASSHSRQSSNDDSSDLYSNESNSSKSSGEEGYSSDESSIKGVKLMQGKSMSHDRWAQKCHGLQKEVYKAKQEAADNSKSIKILNKAVDKEESKRDAGYEKLVKKSLEVKALKLEKSQLQKLKSNFDKELKNIFKLSEALKEKTNSIKHLEDFLKEKKAECKRLNDRNILLEREQSAIQKTAAK